MSVFVSDTFTDTATTALTAHTGGTGATWTLAPSATGSMLISNANRVFANVNPVGNNCDHYASGIPATADYDVEAVIRRVTNATGATGVLGRVSTSATTKYSAFLYFDGQFYLYKNVAGTETQLGVYNAVTADNTNYTVKLEMRGTAIKAYLDGVLRISATDGAITAAGRAGIESQGLYTDTTGFHIDTFTATDAALDVLLVNDANLFKSPSGWRTSGSTYTQTTNPGCYLKFKTTSTFIGLAVDVTPLTGGSVSALDYPTILSSVDNAAYTRTQITSADTTITLGSGLAASAHEVEVIFVACDIDSYDRWTTPVMALRVTGIVVDTGATLAAPTLLSGRAICYGDSGSEGVEILASGQTAVNQDASQAYPYHLMNALACEGSIIAFAGQGFTIAPTVFSAAVNVVDLEASWDLYSAGQSRLTGGLFVPAPDYILCTEGFNDNSQGASGASVQTAIVNLIAAWRTAAPLAKIFFCAPVDRSEASNINAAIVTSGDKKTYILDPSEDFYIAKYKNGNHNSVRGHARIAAAMARQACVKRFLLVR